MILCYAVMSLGALKSMNVYWLLQQKKQLVLVSGSLLDLNVGTNHNEEFSNVAQLLCPLNATTEWLSSQ